MDIKAEIRKARPNVRDSTINKYAQGVRKLHQLAKGNHQVASLDFLKDKSKITELIEANYKPNTRANMFNVAVVALMTDKQYKDLAEFYGEKRDHEHGIYESLVRSNKKSQKQEENWVSLAEIDKVLFNLQEHYNEIYDIFLAERKLSRKQYLKAQEYIVLAIHRQIPMRNDLANLQWAKKGFWASTGNYIYYDDNPVRILLRNYKTSGKYGTKEIEVEDETLNRQIKQFQKMNKYMEFKAIHTNSFLLNSKMEPMSSNGLTKLLTRIFTRDLDKKISSSMLRHIYLSEKYGKELEERKKDSHNMLHSLEQQKNYIKTD